MRDADFEDLGWCWPPRDIELPEVRISLIVDACKAAGLPVSGSDHPHLYEPPSNGLLDPEVQEADRIFSHFGYEFQQACLDYHFNDQISREVDHVGELIEQFSLGVAQADLALQSLLRVANSVNEPLPTGRSLSAREQRIANLFSAFRTSMLEHDKQPSLNLGLGRMKMIAADLWRHWHQIPKRGKGEGGAPPVPWHFVHFINKLATIFEKITGESVVSLSSVSSFRRSGADSDRKYVPSPFAEFARIICDEIGVGGPDWSQVEGGYSRIKTALERRKGLPSA